MLSDLSYVEDMTFMLRCIRFGCDFMLEFYSCMTILVIVCRSDDYFLCIYLNCMIYCLIRNKALQSSSTRGTTEFSVCIDKSVIKRSYLTMQCERSGIYKPRNMRKKPNLEGIDSRKCNCLFRLKGFFDKDTNDWWLAMLCGMHNHDLDEKLFGHPYCG